MKVYELVYLEKNVVNTIIAYAHSIREAKTFLTENQMFLNAIDRTPEIDIEKLKSVLEAAGYTELEITFIITNL